MATKKLRPVHPGDILRHDLMEPVTAPTVNEIARRRRPVTAEMALRLSRYFGTTAQFWQNLQSQYDLEIATQKIGNASEYRAYFPSSTLTQGASCVAPNALVSGHIVA
jgi:antitoxin HigA-1